MTKVDALKDRPDEALLRVEVELELFLHIGPDLLYPELDLLLAVSENDDVVHIADVVADAELPLRVVVDDVLVHVCEHLIEKAPHGETLVRDHFFGRDLPDALPQREAEFLAGSIDE